MLHRVAGIEIKLLLAALWIMVPSGLVAQGSITTYVTKPISSTMILPDTAPSSLPGTVSDTISVRAALGEYEPASFVVRSTADITAMTVQATDLTSEANTLPASNVDIRFVKCWYQSEGAWVTQDRVSFNKVLCPELILKDDKLITVDTVAQKNYIKVVISGTPQQICISDKPNVPEPWTPGTPGIYQIAPGIDTNTPMAQFPVRDSATLQPIDIKAGKNHQVWVTVYVPETTPSGTYNGKIRLSQSGNVLKELSLELNVLPFALSSPKTYYDPNVPYTSSIYYRGQLDPTGNGSTTNDIKSEAQFLAEFQNMIRHGVTQPSICLPYSMIANNDALFRNILRIRRNAGITGPYYMLFDLVLNQQTQAALDQMKTKIIHCMNIAREYGITEFYFYGIDEATGELQLSQRAAWMATHEVGGKVMVSAYPWGGTFEAIGDLLDLVVMMRPVTVEEARRWHSVDHLIWSYANPQSGPENPALFRQNYGLFLWKSEYDGGCTYTYQTGNGGWNDFNDISRDLSLTYPTVDGVIDTIAWEGYREGIDDIRYACTMMAEIGIAKSGQDNWKKQVAAEAEAFIGNIDGSGDLDAVRGRIVDYIMALKFGTPLSEQNEDRLAVGYSGSGGGVTIYDTSAGVIVNSTSMRDLGDVGSLCFGADGKLYVASFQATTDTRPWDVIRYPTGVWTPGAVFSTLPNHRAVSAKRHTDGYLYLADVAGVIYKSNAPGAAPTSIVGGMGGDCRGMVISPEGILYLCSQGPQRISRFNINTSTMLTPWSVRQINGQTPYPNSIVFGPDATGDGKSDLYVCYWAQPIVDIYNGQTGAYYGVFEDLANYGRPNAIVPAAVFSQDGSTAYICDFTDGMVFKKIGNAPATELIFGISSPRALGMPNEYNSPNYIAVADAKKLRDGILVTCSDKVVTAVFGDYFYLEEPDRFSGIRARKTGHGLQVGDLATVTGIMATETTGERYIDASTGVVSGYDGTQLDPLAMNNKSLGGGDWFYDAGIHGGQRGVVDGSGLNNIGLLVKTTGRVVQPIGSGYFTLSDGSDVSVMVLAAGGLPQENSYVIVTGISSCENDGSGLRRMVRATGWQTVSGP